MRTETIKKVGRTRILTSRNLYLKCTGSAALSKIKDLKAGDIVELQMDPFGETITNITKK